MGHGRGLRGALLVLAALGLPALAGPAAAKHAGDAGVPAATNTPPDLSLRSGRPLRADVEALLPGRRPINEHELGELGPRVDETLIEIASDARTPVGTRVRALAAMAYTKTTAARLHLRGLIDGAFKVASETDRALVRQAALSYGWQSPPGAPELLGGLLGHPDPSVRSDAAAALALTRVPEAIYPLERHVESEKDPAVHAQLVRQLQNLRQAVGKVAPPPPIPSRNASPPPSSTDIKSRIPPDR